MASNNFGPSTCACGPCVFSVPFPSSYSKIRILDQLLEMGEAEDEMEGWRRPRCIASMVCDKFLRKQNYFEFEASSEDGRKASDEYTYVWVSKLSSQFPTLTGCGHFRQNHSTIGRTAYRCPISYSIVKTREELVEHINHSNFRSKLI